MGPFDNFDWDESVRDKGNNIVEIKKINILYGRNYSGKTTLSRILRAIEKRESPSKYVPFKFSIQNTNGESISQDDLSESNKTIRVFNKDFVKENLQFIIDDEGEINSFAILGRENDEIKNQIDVLESELGTEQDNTGLHKSLKLAEEKKASSHHNFKDAKNSLGNKLKTKARQIKEGNVKFGDVNYNITKIERDIEEVRKPSYTQINDAEKNDFENLLKEDAKKEIQNISDFDLKFELLSEETKKLTEHEITVSEPIKELVNDSILQEWVKAGREIHKGNRESCGFCGNDLSQDLWEKLDKHFNEESEKLETSIAEFIQEIDLENTRVPHLATIDQQHFYSKFHNDLSHINDDFQEKSNSYLQSLESLKNQLNNKQKNIITAIKFTVPEINTSELLAIQNRLQKIVRLSNEYSRNLDAKHRKAKKLLRLNEVSKFIYDIGYGAECKKVSALEKTAGESNESYGEKRKVINAKNIKMEVLQSQLQDEGAGANRVNDFLANFFGHHALSLSAVSDPNNELPSYKFEINRDGEKAYNLSEGECSLISFCYFMAKLEDIETTGKKPIIWIDDPVSSLDSNHIFFVFSLIDSQIIKQNKYEQFFISTHNLDFLKYLKSISNNRDEAREFFLVERKNKKSNISVMPKYMKEYITEFNYLFHQIYKCANDESMNDENFENFYNFGNNVRKFLEIFLFYQYPTTTTDISEKFYNFFGKEDIPRILINRIKNEYSHLLGSLERGSEPIETVVPAMQLAAKFILDKIKCSNEEQYNHFLKSINVETNTSGSPESPSPNSD